MRILLWHGYLLGGTGSNVYTRSLARAWSRLGHEVVVLCQEPHPERYDLGGARVVRPRLTGPLPVFVLDQYADARPQLLPEMSEADRERFVEENAAAVRAEGPADLLLVNHVLLGGPVGAASGLPHVVVKAHGSELEFSIRGDAGLAAWARESLAGARAVLAGSEHIERVLAEVVGSFDAPVAVVPPGVDVEALRPRPREEALAALVHECRLDPPNDAGEERRPDDGNAERLGAFLAGDARTVVYVGKLSEEKGVSLLLAALRAVDACAVVVGFGPQRAALEAQARESGLADRVLFTGALEHRHLAPLWALADVSVTPSVFPEAFGMVAAEAAACGSPPVVARQSGLAEVAAALERRYPVEHRHLAGFRSGDVDDLVATLRGVLELDARDRLAVSEAARRTAVEQWSWEGIAQRILDLVD